LFIIIKGNQFFKDNLLNEAINCYTKAMELDPAKAVYPANRAMCMLKQEK
jgi:predicted Zn-dependent protease